MTQIARRGTPLGLVAPLVSLLLALVTWSGCVFGGFEYQGADLNLLFMACAFIAGYGALIRLANKESRIGGTLQAVGLFGAMAVLTSLASAVLAHGDVGYVDGTLDTLDRILVAGFDWPSLIAALASHPRVMVVLSHAYVSLNWQPLVLFGAMMVKRAGIDPHRFIAVWALGLLACVLRFHWLPARGAYLFYHIPFAAVHGLLVHLPWEYPMTLEGLRTGTVHTLGVQSAVGLVTVPSFHACAAVMLAWGFRPVAWLRWPFALLNGLMLVSAVPIGGHYLTDIVMGVLCAIGAIASADQLARLGRRGVRSPRAAMVPTRVASPA